MEEYQNKLAAEKSVISFINRTFTTDNLKIDKMTETDDKLCWIFELSYLSKKNQKNKSVNPPTSRRNVKVKFNKLDKIPFFDEF